MLSVSWMHLGFLDEMQLYDLAFRVCARARLPADAAACLPRRPSAIHVPGEDDSPYAKGFQLNITAHTSAAALTLQALQAAFR